MARRWRGAICFVAAAAIFASISFTLMLMLPINNSILEPARDKASAETRTLLERWGRLHAVRTVVSLAASVLFAVAWAYSNPMSADAVTTRCR